MLPPRSLLCLAVLLLPTPSLLAQLSSKPGDWPAFRGPERTNLSTEKGLLQQWPAGGPKLAWKIKGLGDGFSTPALAGGRIFVLGTRGREEYVIALNSMDGKQLWASKIGAEAGGHPGPRSTPTVVGDLLYAISSNGNLVCLETSTGKERWRKNFEADLGGKHGSWAYAESPLVDGDLVVCTPGGSAATITALDRKTGSVILKAPVQLGGGKKRAYSTAAYSSIMVAEMGGVKQYIQFLSGGVVGVSARDGKLLWHYERPANGTANCSTPLVQGDRVFAASAYGTGGGQVKITGQGDSLIATEQFFVKQLQNHHGGLILLGDHIYGTGSSSLLCVNWKTGKVEWQDRCVGKGSIAYADGHLYVRSENGPIALVEATPMRYVEKGRFDQPDRSQKKAWPYPVVCGGRLYIRDWDTLLCYDIKGQ